MIEKIDESIDVVAAFTEGKILPVLFSWRNRRYKNLKVNAMWSRTEGDAKIVNFSVTADNSNLYELCFNTRFFQWSLLKIHHR
jgi:lipocalin